MSAIGRPTRSISGRHAGELREAVVPLEQSQIRVQHRDAVRHAGEGGLELGGLRVGPRLGGLELGVGRFKHGLIAGQPLLAPPVHPQLPHQASCQDQHEHGDADAEDVRAALPSVGRPQRTRAVVADHHDHVAAGHPAERVDADDPIGR